MERSSVTEVNEFLVLDAIRSAGEATRPQLATSLGLSAASVSRIVRRLLAQGLVSDEPGPSDGVGRNRDVLRFNRRAGAVIAIDLGGTKCHGALADLAGEVAAEDVRPTFASGSPAQSLLASVAALRDAAAQEVPAGPGGLGRYPGGDQSRHGPGRCGPECALARIRPGRVAERGTQRAVRGGERREPGRPGRGRGAALASAGPRSSPCRWEPASAPRSCWMAASSGDGTTPPGRSAT